MCGMQHMSSGWIFLVPLLIGCIALAEEPPNKEMREALAAHNAARAGVGAPPLTWSNPLAKIAQQWATYLLAENKFVHRSRPTYGENLFDVTGGRFSPSQVVTSWMGEAKNYNAKTNKCRLGAVCGHFTQVIWKNTKRLGCGVARSRQREVWVCNYDPPGNWRGESPF